MLDFLNLEPEIFGLDINDSSFKIIKLRKKRGFLQPVSFNEKEIPQGIIEDGIIQDENAFVKNIKDALAGIKGEKLKTKYVVASLPEEKSFSQVIKMPKMEAEELKSAVIFEAENYIPLPADQMYMDFKRIDPIADPLDHMDVLIVAVEKTLVDSYVSCLKKSGLIPVALEVETQAIARALVKNETSLTPLVLIDFGSDTTDFIVFSGHSIRFTSSIPISSQQVTQALSNGLGISLREAEHMKVKYGFDSEKPNHRAKAASKAIEPVLEQLASEIQKYLDFYSEHNFHEHLLKQGARKSNMEKIILSGGGANLRGIDGFLAKKLNIPVELGNPWVNFSSKLRKIALPELPKKSLSFVTALGLALRGVMLNLLPPNEKKILLQEQQKRLFIVLSAELLIFLMCILLVFLAVEFYILGEVSSQKFLLEQAQAQNQSSDFSNLKETILKYNKELTLIDSFHRNQKLMNGALDILLEVQRPNGLYFTNLSLQPLPQPDKIKINIAGVSNTRENLLAFRGNIEAEKKIENVNFSPESWISQKNVNFNVTLEVYGE